MSKDLIMLCTGDYSGILRGHAIVTEGSEPQLPISLLWPMENSLLTAFDAVVPCFEAELLENPAHGDLRLHSGRQTLHDAAQGSVPQTSPFLLCDITDSQGEAWPACPRGFLRQSLDALESRFGLEIVCGYEHQFCLDTGADRTSAFALSAFNPERDFAQDLARALDHQGPALESFGPGRRAGQVIAGVAGLAGKSAPDNAYVFRETARAIAAERNRQITFAPLDRDGGRANSLVLRLGLHDRGDQMTYDRHQPHGVARPLGQFLAGVLAHLPALAAFTLGSGISYRTREEDPSAPRVGLHHRGALARLIPLNRSETTGTSEIWLEFHVADATANPHLQLAALVQAGIQGLAAELETPPIDDPSTATDGAMPPGSLAAALDALAADSAFTEGFPAPLLKAYQAVKRAEVEAVAGSDVTTQAAHYAAIY